MTDDELIVLWSLAGMELWAELKRFNYLDIYVNLVIRHCFGLDILESYAVFVSDGGELFIGVDDVERISETIYIIDDILTFNPDERWWKLLLAKRWYSKNRDQFND